MSPENEELFQQFIEQRGISDHTIHARVDINGITASWMKLAFKYSQ